MGNGHNLIVSSCGDATKDPYQPQFFTFEPQFLTYKHQICHIGDLGGLTKNKKECRWIHEII
jgi:hypothetical protein